MKDKTSTILRIFLTALLVVSAALFIIFFIKGEDFTNTMLWWAYILLIFTIAITFIFPIINMISNPKQAITVLVGLVGFVVLFGIAYYVFADSNVDSKVYEQFHITPAISKIIGGILWMTYILGGLTVLSIVYAGISSLLK
ncbi:MAG TPA: hypothetical protein VFC92_10070 [Bacteroidales bacterium]|nr:hypothetical protein [Bacteroidales bacterium]